MSLTSPRRVEPISAHKATFICLPCRIRYIIGERPRPTGEPPKWLHGARFGDLDPEARVFVRQYVEEKILAAFQSALVELTERLGAEMSDWTWSRLHLMPLTHVLSSRGELATLLDHGGVAVKGDMGTVCATECACGR